MSSSDRTPASGHDPFDLARFLAAQEGAYAIACRELTAGRKQNHWMWFVFPQMRGLGHSAMAQRFAISSLPEAKAYIGHRVLGQRLLRAAELLLTIENGSALDILGSPDDMKLRSSMTLFAAAAPQHGVFQAVLDRYFDGSADEATLHLIGKKAPAGGV